ncbi:MAG: molybdopterin biosynthesis protein [Thermoprotei archaeon]|nr:MAG: molybdopterin biosynthesis protein [Thermoprotei archaeon]
MSSQDRKLYRRLVSVDEVISIIEKYFPLSPRGEEEVYIGEAVGRIASRDVYSTINFPPYTRSLVDGYAVLSGDLEGVYEDRPARLKLVGKVSTGETKVLSIKRGECIEVSTGAIIPYPADAVVPVEYTHSEGDEVVFYRSVAHGENIDIVGSDVVQGEVVLWKGETITPLTAAGLSAVGVDRVWVYRKIRVGIIPTGNEIRRVGEELKYGQIYDSNSHMVYSLVNFLGSEPKIYEPARDTFDEIKERVDQALAENDVVVTIGGTSAGLEDYVYKVFDTYEPGVIIHGVKEKPGRPLVVAVARDKLLLGLPGFPLSCLITSHLYLLPIVARLQGLKGYRYQVERAKLSQPLRGRPGIRVFVPTILVRRGETLAYPLDGHSGRIASLNMIDGFIIVREDEEYVPQGSSVDVLRYIFSKIYDINVIGSHCPLFQEILRKIFADTEARIVNVGSTSGLNALKSGIADIVGTHLLDPETMEYNIPVIKRMGLKDVVVLRGYIREQGFVYRKEIGEVKGMLDIMERKLRFVNRNPGSGTRVLIDYLIEEESRKKGYESEEVRKNIQGYSFEAKNHDTIAYLVSKGIADVGVAIKYVADKYGLAFTPIREERYDIVIRKDVLDRKDVNRLVQLFRGELKTFIKGFTGYEVDEETGKIIEL